MSNTKRTASLTTKIIILGLIAASTTIAAVFLNNNPFSKTANTSDDNIDLHATSATDQKPTRDHPRILINTQRGKVLIELYPEKAPKTVTELTSLIKSGYYDTETVMESRPGLGFVIAKVGDSAKSFEFTDDTNALTSQRGSVAISKSSASHAYLNNIFIGYNAQPDLEKYYTIIGRVIEGIDTGENAAAATLYKIVGVQLLDDTDRNAPQENNTNS